MKKLEFPIVAIIGRKNTGKSTLFNKIITEPKSLVSDIPGTTRDIQTALTSWRGKTFNLVDTGGLDVRHYDEIEERVKLQAEKVIRKARVSLFVVDVRTGLLPQDRLLARQLLPGKKNIIFVANKADSVAARLAVEDKEWLKLGLGAPRPVSALTGIGVGDLLDEIVERLEKSKKNSAEPLLKIAVIGKPNVGKSSLLNAILGEERFITSPRPHTTREPVDTLIYYLPRRPDALESEKPLEPEVKIPILLVDTAGIRRRARVLPGIESIGVRRSIEAVKRANVVIFILDLSEPIGAQDKQLAALLAEERKAVVILGNKWDLVKLKMRNEKVKIDKEYKNLVYRYVPALDFAPVIFTSALEKKNTHKVIDAALEVHKKGQIELAEKELLEFWEKIKKIPVVGGGVKHPRVYSFKQTGKNPPTFHLAVREREPLNPAYLRFLEKRMREWYDLEGVPITIMSKNIKK